MCGCVGSSTRRHSSLDPAPVSSEATLPGSPHGATDAVNAADVADAQISAARDHLAEVFDVFEQDGTINNPTMRFLRVSLGSKKVGRFRFRVKIHKDSISARPVAA